MMLNGIPEVVNKSPVFGTLLIVERIYLGFALPKSTPTYSTSAEGGCVD
jgi:hypothetical protein